MPDKVVVYRIYKESQLNQRTSILMKNRQKISIDSSSRKGTANKHMKRC